ncbi:unnamed protein product [marine sediment metagenome]|uniref:Uncharacterized protein n=1 Tax=marine sediment metagenome TaxID=412755 RepID=X0SJS9_9ZZZZ
MPDMGPFEFSQPVPRYGLRSDLSDPSFHMFVALAMKDDIP